MDLSPRTLAIAVPVHHVRVIALRTYRRPFLSGCAARSGPRNLRRLERLGSAHQLYDSFESLGDARKR
jgi:hypothetical protein